MKKVLCYGDSNTFGFNPVDGSRFDNETRWTAILGNKLGDEYNIIEEGACDRTGFVDNDKGVLYSAQKHFPSLLSNYNDIDVLILSVGTNDLQAKYNIDLTQIENGLKTLIETAQSKVKNFILVSPVILDEDVLKGFFSFQFDETSILKSKEAEKIYDKLSKIYGLKYVDLNRFIRPSSVDGLHYDTESQKIIADKLSEYIKL